MSYTGELLNPIGQHYAPLNNIISLEYARSFGNVGELSVTIPDRKFNPQSIKRNWRVKIMRHVTGYAPSLVGNTVWFTRSVSWRPLDKTVTIRAQDALTLLKDRIVAYTSQTSYADKTDEELGSTPYADDSMNDYLRENFGADAVDTDRDISDYLLVPENKSFGAQANKEGSWQDILSVLQDLARASTQLGVPILYDVSMNENGIFVFNTWVGRRGTDRTLGQRNAHVFSVEKNNLSELELVWDYSDEKNVVYVGGYDTGASRVIAKVVDDTRVRLDPFARTEVFVDGGDNDVIAVLEDIGRIALEGFRPTLKATATTVETPESIYGVHYNYADTVSLVARGIEIACDISAVSGNFSDGKDTIALRLSGQRQL